MRPHNGWVRLVKEVERRAQPDAWHMKESPPRLRWYGEIRYESMHGYPNETKGFHTFAAYGWSAAEALEAAETEAAVYALRMSEVP
jgi:hypothetical protein